MMPLVYEVLQIFGTVASELFLSLVSTETKTLWLELGSKACWHQKAVSFQAQFHSTLYQSTKHDVFCLIIQPRLTSFLSSPWSEQFSAETT